MKKERKFGLKEFPRPLIIFYGGYKNVRQNFRDKKRKLPSSTVDWQEICKWLKLERMVGK